MALSASRQHMPLCVSHMDWVLLDDCKQCPLEEALYITYGKANLSVLVESNDHLTELIKITKHGLIQGLF